MLISISLILFSGLLLGKLCEKLHFPALFGMLIAGILMGPYALDLLDGSILAISAQLRRIALIIILLRAGLKLELSDLKKVGRPAVLLCFLPACCEVLGMVLLAPRLLGLSILDAAILGAVVGAVSPAVVVPRMIKLIDQSYGTDKGIPQMILAGASVDDVFVIVLFTTFTGLAQGEAVSWTAFLKVPASILTGVLAGAAVGAACAYLFKRGSGSATTQVLLLLSTAFVLNWLEETFPALPFAGLIAIMAMGTRLRRKDGDMAAALSHILDRLWTPAEIFLFVLVGSCVAIDSLTSAGPSAVLLILGVLLFRMAGVFLCTMATPLDRRERLFCMLAYTPKATVQAAIGGLPLAMGLPCGMTVLTVSVVAILLTAPLGAFAIDLTYPRLLSAPRSDP